MQVNRIGCFFVSLWFGAAAAGAGDADPQSNACQRALAALQARESELAAATGAQTPPRTPTDARWQALRASAARACLGRESTAPVPPPRSALPPIAVPPVTPPAAAEVPPRRTPAPLPPPVPT